MNQFRDFPWTHGYIQGVERPNQGPIDIVVTNSTGDVISKRHLFEPSDPPRSQSEIDYHLLMKMREIARDITYHHFGYKLPEPAA